MVIFSFLLSTLMLSDLTFCTDNLSKQLQLLCSRALLRLLKLLALFNIHYTVLIDFFNFLAGLFEKRPWQPQKKKKQCLEYINEARVKKYPMALVRTAKYIILYLVNRF